MEKNVGKVLNCYVGGSIVFATLLAVNVDYGSQCKRFNGVLEGSKREYVIYEQLHKISTRNISPIFPILK